MAHKWELVMRCTECGFLIRQPYSAVPNKEPDHVPSCKHPKPAKSEPVDLMGALKKALYP